MESIRRIAFRFVNAYLVRTEAGFLLIDTGLSFERRKLLRDLDDAGCGPGTLNLIVITHGDADHSGNAAYLRDAYGTPIAMHRAESGAVERGDMFLSRGPLSLPRRMLKPLMALFRLRVADRFVPDLEMEDGDRLDAYGLNGRVFHVPGHSRGSIAVLTDRGALFSGDFLENRRRPSVATLVDDAGQLAASYDRIAAMKIGTVFPGHGSPFAMDEIKRRRRTRHV